MDWFSIMSEYQYVNIAFEYYQLSAQNPQSIKLCDCNTDLNNRANNCLEIVLTTKNYKSEKEPAISIVFVGWNSTSGRK